VQESYTKHITFNPGPSQISKKIIDALSEIAAEGFLSCSHRSARFSEVSKQAIEGLKDRLGIPASFHIFYQPSATAAMDSLLRNLVKKKVIHFVNGHFSGVFHKTSVGIGLEALCVDAPWNDECKWREVKIPADCELIAITHNETSTGVMWPREEIHDFRLQYPDPLLVVDVTSTFGSMVMDWNDADVWFGSIQKCLGLPSGLGYLIVNERAFERALEIITHCNNVAPFHRFDELASYMRIYQTPETPNLVAIALLAKQMQDWDLPKIEAQTKEKAKMLYEAPLPWQPYVKTPAWRSLTVPNFLVDTPAEWHKAAEAKGMTLGAGYGKLVDSCFRLAVFPAVSKDDVQKLLQTFQERFGQNV
jgi:phosphoserine aminotransferase